MARSVSALPPPTPEPGPPTGPRRARSRPTAGPAPPARSPAREAHRRRRSSIDSTPPRLVANTQRSSAATNAVRGRTVGQLDRRSATRNRSWSAPRPRARDRSAARDSAPGSTAGWAASRSASTWALASAALSRSGSVRRPAEHQVRLHRPGRAPPCSLRTPSSRPSRAGSRPTSSPEQRVGVPGDELRRRSAARGRHPARAAAAAGEWRRCCPRSWSPGPEGAADRRQVRDLHRRVGRATPARPDPRPRPRPAPASVSATSTRRTVSPSRLGPFVDGGGHPEVAVGRQHEHAPAGTSSSAACAAAIPLRTPARCRPPAPRPLPPVPTRSGCRTGRSPVRPDRTARPRRRSTRTPPAG